MRPDNSMTTLTGWAFIWCVCVCLWVGCVIGSVDHIETAAVDDKSRKGARDNKAYIGWNYSEAI